MKRVWSGLVLAPMISSSGAEAFVETYCKCGILMTESRVETHHVNGIGVSGTGGQQPFSLGVSKTGHTSRAKENLVSASVCRAGARSHDTKHCRVDSQVMKSCDPT